MNNSKQISCSKCSITFSTKGNFYRHQKRFHSSSELSIPSPSSIKGRVCPVCNDKVDTITHLHHHIINEHEGINLKFESKTFDTDKEFQDWKSAFEKSTTSFFRIKRNNVLKSKIVSYYECHRSGKPVLVNETNRMKHPKSSGSIKIGKTCPAAIRMTKQDNKIVAEFQSTHVGHEQEPERLRLTREERCKIAKMLERGISSRVVLDKMRQKYSSTKRFRYSPRQDIYNIKRDFHIKNPSHKDDSESVEILAPEKSVIATQIEKKGKIVDISAQKASLALEIHAINDEIQSLESLEDLNIIGEHIKTLRGHLQAIKNKPSLSSVLEIPKYAPSNKAIEQKRKFIIKKKQYRK